MTEREEQRTEPAASDRAPLDMMSFTAPLSLLDFGRFAYRVIYVPAEVADRLPIERHPRLRVEGEIDGVPFEGSFQPSTEGRYLLVNPATCRAAGIAVGDPVTVRFTIADQDGVTVPDELTILLLEDGAAMAQWVALTPGRQRGLAHHVASAKRAETRAKRAEAIAATLAAGEVDALPGAPRRPVRRARTSATSATDED